jgi:[ribosomal protein S5]-alanine N-acetyltransferase
VRGGEATVPKKSTQAGAVPAYAEAKSTPLSSRSRAAMTIPGSLWAESNGVTAGTFDSVRTIQTARLLLVPVTPVNAETLWALLQEPDLRDYQDLPDVDRAQFLRVVSARPARLAPGVTGRFEWLLRYVTGDGDPLGWVSLRIAESSRATAEIGYSVIRAHRGRGIASEAVAALVEEAFLRARLSALRAYCLPENLSSRAVLRHNGFEDEGRLPRGATVQGKPVDVIVHTLERDHWASQVTKNPAAIRS